MANAAMKLRKRKLNESPRPFSTDTDAVLWADVVLGEPAPTELLR